MVFSSLSQQAAMTSVGEGLVELCEIPLLGIPSRFRSKTGVHKGLPYELISRLQNSQLTLG